MLLTGVQTIDKVIKLLHMCVWCVCACVVCVRVCVRGLRACASAWVRASV